MAISPSPFDRARSRRRAGLPYGPMLLGVAVVVLILLAVYFRGPASDIFWRVMAPVARVRDALSQGEATRLRAELASTTAALADRSSLYKENADLKARLGRTDAQRRILAAVLQHPPWTAYDTLLIDTGEAQGIRTGELVFAGGNALIGSISEVYSGTARVELFSTPGASYQALLNGTTMVAVEGQGGNSLRAEVPAGTSVSVGDVVVFPGLMGGIAAEVVALDAQDGLSFIVIYMRLPVNPQELRYVEVLQP